MAAVGQVCPMPTAILGVKFYLEVFSRLVLRPAVTETITLRRRREPEGFASCGTVSKLKVGNRLCTTHLVVVVVVLAGTGPGEICPKTTALWYTALLRIMLSSPLNPC
jgi:hypothetical protein